MGELTVELQRRFAAPPEAVWDLLVDPRSSLRHQRKARLRHADGAPGTIGFVYSMVPAGSERRVDTVEVVEADRPRLLRERVSSDLLATLAPGEAVHPSEQLTRLVPHDGGTLLHWSLRTPAPLWSRPLVRWSARRTVAAIFDGLASELDGRS